MPLFTYACESCGQTSELLVRNGESPACPACGSEQLVKQASAIRALATAGGSEPAPVGCGASNCCQLQGGCGLN